MGCKSQKIPLDFTLSFSAGGGFTGRWSGYVVDHAGNVAQWNGTKRPENLEPLGRLAEKDLKALRKAFDEAKFMTLKRDEPSNMTVELALIQDGKSNTVRFPMPSNPTINDEDPLLRLYAWCKQTLKPLQAKS